MQKTEFLPFAMERWQSIHEHRVEYNLSESGVHPLSLRELVELSGTDTLDDTLLGYGQSNGSDLLRDRIARLYHGCTSDSIVVTNGSAEANFIALWELAQPGSEIGALHLAGTEEYGPARQTGAASEDDVL